MRFVGMVAFSVTLATLAACGSGAGSTSSAPAATSPQTNPTATLVVGPQVASGPPPVLGQPVKLADGLEYYDITVGTGAVATAGKTVTVNYTGWLTNGTQFDSSYDRNQPFSFVLGMGQVIPGWDEGVAGMRVGGKRRLVIPPALGYGASGAGNTIPPNATLIFDVELLSVQ